MKQFFLVLFLTGIAITSLQSQTIADTLEMAYVQFSKKEYKKSAACFDHFLSKVTGQPKDYYLAGVCYANTGDTEKSLEYLNKAANTKAEYYMMLNDPELKAVQPQISEIVARFEQLDKLYNQKLERYSPNKNVLFSIDSLYKLLPPGKIAKKQLRNIAHDFLSGAKDTVKFFYYLAEQLQTYQNKDEKKEFFKDLEYWIKAYKVGAATKDKLLAIGPYRYFHAMTLVYSTDSLRYHLSKVPYEVSLKCMPTESYISIFEVLTKQGDYNQAFSFLYAGLANRAIDTKKIFESKSCSEFFKQPVGKSFLTILLSEEIIPTIESSDRVFVASAYQYLSSNRLTYEFIKTMNFDTKIPDLKSYLVSKNVYGPKAAGKSVVVSDTYPYGLYEDELDITIDTLLGVALAKKDRLDFFTPKEEVLVVKNTPSPDYAYSTGAYYRQPVGNVPFILAVKKGKIRKSLVPSIRDNYFQKLVPYGIKSIFYNNPDREDLRYFAFVYGYNTLETYFEEMMQLAKKEDIQTLAKLIPHLVITRTSAGFGFLARVLGNPEEFLPEKKDESQDIYINLKKIADYYIEKLAGPAAFDSLKIGTISLDATEDEAKVWKDASVKISNWWEQYKKMPLYTLPPLVKSAIAEQKGLPEDTKSLILTASNGLLFYNPSDKEISSFTKETQAQQVEEVSILAEDVIDTRAPSRNNDISGLILGDTGYVFSPNQRDRASHLSIVPGLTEKELNSLKEAYQDLGLSKTGQNLIAGDYDKSFDRFFVYRFNKQLAVFWFTGTNLYASFLGADGKLSQTPVAILFTRELTREANNTPYEEMVYNIHSLQFEKLGNNLLVACNVEVKGKPKFSEQQWRVYLELLGPNLKPIAEKAVFTEIGQGYDSYPSIFVKSTPNNVYVLAQSRESNNKVYGKVFNLKLESKGSFSFDQNTSTNSQPDPLNLIKADGENIYCLYSRTLHGDVLLAMNKINADGRVSKPVYLYQSQGYLNDYKGFLSGGNFNVYLLEKSFQKDWLKKITIPVGVLKF